MRLAMKNWLENYMEVRSYSGRGMFGARCLAIQGDSIKDCMQGIGEAIKLAASRIVDAAEPAEEDEEPVSVLQAQRDFDDLVDRMMDFRTDNMGLGVVVYWPDEKWVEED